jgi:hypothetical protein
MERYDIVTLVTDPTQRLGTVVGVDEKGQVCVAWHIGRTWIYKASDLRKVA